MGLPWRSSANSHRVDSSGLLHFQHNLPPRMPRFALLVRLGGIPQRYDHRDDRLDLASIDHVSNLCKLRRIGMHQNPGSAGVVLLRSLLVWPADDAYQDATGLEHAPRFLLGFAADRVQHYVGVFDELREILRA